MIKIILAFAAVFMIVASAYANCTTQTVSAPDGKLIFCQTCCTGNGNCVTTCF